jgi:hypothetical protein
LCDSIPEVSHGRNLHLCWMHILSVSGINTQTLHCRYCCEYHFFCTVDVTCI